ncbi:MAG TPA: DUF2914 domain-containing protein [Desulfobacteraceae bacterium]|nr:DUF2914 domain-containing protein [Desulfobacteraceae bacterium]
MTRFQTFLIVIVSAVALGFGFSNTAFSQGQATVSVADASLCIDVVDLSCVGENDQFPVQAGKIYCFSRIIGAQGPTTITHVWYYEDHEVARVDLAVKSPNWRTYSSKRLLPSQIGEWHVDILGSEGELLREIVFNVTPQ